MATQIVDFNGLKADSENMVLTEDVLKNKIDNLTEEDIDDDSIILNMSDISDLAEAIAMVKCGLERISEITQVDVSEDAIEDIEAKVSQYR